MQFLRTLFWVVVAAFLSIIATTNWRNVTIDLWGGLQADVKIPVLMAVMFLVGFLPTYLILRGKIWRLKVKLTNAERRTAEPAPVLEPGWSEPQGEATPAA